MYCPLPFRASIIGLWDHIDRATLEKAPAVLVLRPTHFAAARAVAGKTRVNGIHIETGQMMGRHYDFQRLITAAYDDFLVAVREQPEQRLQAEIEKQFGMVARPRVIQTNALLLTLKNPNLLKSLATQEPMTMDQFNQTVPFASLVKQWEIDLEIPIAD